jgi:hypothetical protein
MQKIADLNAKDKEVLMGIVAKHPSSVTESEEKYLRARSSYLTGEQLDKYGIKNAGAGEGEGSEKRKGKGDGEDKSKGNEKGKEKGDAKGQANAGAGEGEGSETVIDL